LDNRGREALGFVSGIGNTPNGAVTIHHNAPPDDGARDCVPPVRRLFMKGDGLREEKRLTFRGGDAAPTSWA